MPTYPKGAPAARPAFTVTPGAMLHTASERVGILAADLTLNNVIPLVKLPRGAVVVDVVLRVSDMDSSTSGVVSVGVPGDTERYIRRVSCQAAGVFRSGNDTTAAGTMIAAAPLAADTVVGLLVQTAPGTALAGTADIFVSYVME